MMESARQQLQGQAVICGRLVQRSRARSMDQMVLQQLPFVDHSRSQWSQFERCFTSTTPHPFHLGFRIYMIYDPPLTTFDHFRPT